MENRTIVKEKGYLLMHNSTQEVYLEYEDVKNVTIFKDEENDEFFRIEFSNAKDEKLQTSRWQIEVYKPKEEVKVQLDNIKMQCGAVCYIQYMDFWLNYRGRKIKVRRYPSSTSTNAASPKVIDNDGLKDCNENIIIGIFNGILNAQELELENLVYCVQDEMKEML